MLDIQEYLPIMKSIVAVAALFHDVGKANDQFQKKLRSKKVTDDYRHEWLSCCIFSSFVKSCGSEDIDWLNRLSKNDNYSLLAGDVVLIENKFVDLPPVATLVLWLILSHHRLPTTTREDTKPFLYTKINSFQQMVSLIKKSFGYEKHLAKSISFSKGFGFDSLAWRSAMQENASMLLSEQHRFSGLIAVKSFRSAVYYMRLSLMLGDYCASAQWADKGWKSKVRLFANTRDGKLNQKLDEHLIAVAQQATFIVDCLPRFKECAEVVRNIPALQSKSPERFAWQDTVVEEIKQSRAENPSAKHFIINMASTGCGKTFANAKIMQALSSDGTSLRYLLCLGLRSLTLQTGREYRSRVGLGEKEMAVLVGDSSERRLYNKEVDFDEELLDGTLQYADEVLAPVLEILFKSTKNEKKNRAFLAKPVVVATIDHVIRATEVVRGGKWILPFLRLMTSDIVIDEVDDFDQNDLHAVARLVHLAGMLGRNVVISSATVPPDLARALFSSYEAGLHTSFDNGESPIICVWCDEFSSKSSVVCGQNFFVAEHNAFIEKRVARILVAPQKRYCRIVDYDFGKGFCSDYFEAIKNEVVSLHEQNSFAFEGKKISISAIRMANINPCVACAKYLLDAEWGDDTEIRLMVYHSRFPSLLRQRKEEYLDSILCREGDWLNDVFSTDAEIMRHVNSVGKKNILFLVISSPLIELGRDWDFDFGVSEFSSMRSLIQLVGRILRHRFFFKKGIYNISILRYNVLGLKKNELAFLRPGYEISSIYKLFSHDLMNLLPESSFFVNSIPRILKPLSLNAKTHIADLEHLVMQKFADEEGSLGPNGWNDGFTWLTGFSQSYYDFRGGEKQYEVSLCYDDNDSLAFREEWHGHYTKVDFSIKRVGLTEKETERLWLPLDYEDEIDMIADNDKVSLSRQLGKTSIPDGMMFSFEPLYYSDTFGVFKEGIY